VGRLTLVAAVAVVAFTGAALCSPSFVISGDERIGTFAVRKDGTLGGLQAAFGKPGRLSPTRDGCVAVWGSIGLRVSLYNLGGQNPCKPKTGYFGEAVLTGTGWSTGKGLRAGDTVARLRLLYPRAERHGSSWWLLIRSTQATGRYPGLQATFARGTVASFRVSYGAGGE